MTPNGVVFVVFCGYLISPSGSDRILAVMPTPSYSHQIVYNPLWTALSSRGHHITLLTTDPIRNLTLSNFRQVDWSFAYELWERHNVSDIINNFNKNLPRCLLQYVDMMNDIIARELEHPEVRRILADASERFDLVIVEYLNPAMAAFSTRFSCPFIGVSPMDITNFAHEALGHPVSPALFPDFIAPYDSKMTFKERIANFLYYLGGRIFFKYYFYPETDKVVRKYFGDDTPKLEDLQANASMVFLNVNPVMHNIRPLSSNVVNIGGGTHLERDKPLPIEIKNFLDEATMGVIYFSLGTNVKSKDLPADVKNVFLDTFSTLPYRVLWKFEDDSVSPSSNVMMKRWLPQQQILKHRNVKLFITQGGLQSLEEAIYNGIPVVALPTYIDQYSNVKRVVAQGMGVKLTYDDLTQQTLTRAINEVISDRKYRDAAAELSAVLRELPIAGLDLAVWWVEYVLKHRGAKFLRPTHIPLYQYFLLDVILFMACVTSLTLVFFLLLRRHMKKGVKSKVIKLE